MNGIGQLIGFVIYVLPAVALKALGSLWAKRCPRCHGLGRVAFGGRSWPGQLIRCRPCNGSGRVWRWL